jgi:hypothetical protein
MQVHGLADFIIATEERQRLADAVKHHQNIVNQFNQNSVPAQPEGEFQF